jgi:HPt (histidine-containing phosphotransfer) domain-containing protein
VPIIDRDRLMGHVGGNSELLVELIQLLLELGPNMVNEVGESIDRASSDDLQRTAHTLKGSVGNFAADAAVQAALSLEMMGRNHDFSKAHEAFILLKKEMGNVFDELQSLKLELTVPK